MRCISRRRCSRSSDKIVGQAQLGQPEIGRVGVLGEEQRIVGLAEEAGVLARRDRAVADHVRIGDERRHAVRARGELIDDAAVGREQVERIAQPLIVGRRGVAREGVVAGRVVVLHRVRERADQRHLVHPLGRFGQLLADLNLRAARRDRLERRAILIRRIGLHVEHIDMARPAPLKQEDDPLGPNSRPGQLAACSIPRR